MNIFFQVKVTALDAGQGYLVQGVMTYGDPITRQEINEHYATEAEVRTRLGTGFDIWAGNVDAE